MEDSNKKLRSAVKKFLKDSKCENPSDVDTDIVIKYDKETGEVTALRSNGTGGGTEYP